MSGTAFKFTPGQMAELRNRVNAALVTALPDAAARFYDPRTVLADTNNKTQLLSLRLADAIEQILGSMLEPIKHPQRVVTISECRQPAAHYRRCNGLLLTGSSRRVVAGAKAVEKGAVFQVGEDELNCPMTDAQIETKNRFYYKWFVSDALAVLAELNELDQLNRKCDYLLYTLSCVLHVYWMENYQAWHVSDLGRCAAPRDRGTRILYRIC